MNNKKELKQNIINEDKTESYDNELKKCSRKSSKSIKLLWADDLTEVIGENIESNKWISTINSVSDFSDVCDKKIKGILKDPLSTKQVTLES